MVERRGPGQRAGLNRAVVLGAARELLSGGGLEALTMRALAQRLDVAPNTLYSHVSSKTALIDELLDDVLAGVAEPPAHEGPCAALAAVMASTYGVLLDHPDLVPIYLARQGARGPHARGLGEVMIDLLGRAGVQGAAADDALRVLIVYTIGFAAFATRPLTERGAERPLRPDDLHDNFASGLGWLLAGIVGTEAARRPARRTGPRT